MSEDRWTKMMRYVLGTGVIAVSFQDELNELHVTAGTGRNILIDSGAAWIQGMWYENNAPALSKTITANTTLTTRIDLIVLELKWGVDGGVYSKVIQGTVNNTAPIPDQRYGVIWQLPLAKLALPQNYAIVTTAMVTDARNFVSSGTAKTATYVVATYNASPSVRANADAILPDGCTNADVYINAAIASVSTYVGGGTVMLSEGTFNIATHITCKQNVNLVGSGSGTKIVGNSSLDAGIYCSSVDNISIRDLDINLSYVGCTVGQYPTYTNGYGIWVLEGKSVTIERCSIHHCGRMGIFLASADSSATASYGHKVRGCSITDCAHGINVQTNGGLFADNVIFNCGFGMIFSPDPGSPYGSSINTIVGNSIRHIMCKGVMFNGPDQQHGCTQNLFVGNIVSNCSQYLTNSHEGISLSGSWCMFNTIESNTIQSFLDGPRNAYGITTGGGAKDNTIVGNHCTHASLALGDHNIYQGDGVSNVSPNWIRYNHSGSTAQNGNSYDA